MKKTFLLILIVALFSVFSVTTIAQADSTSTTKKVVLDEIKFSSGKGALTEGTYIDFGFSSRKSFTTVTISDQNIMVTKFFRFFWR